LSVDRLGYGLPVGQVGANRPAAATRSDARRPETAFDHFLREAEQTSGGQPADTGSVQFSRHATARLRSRGIELSPDDLDEIGKAVDRLAERNASESLLLVGENAFVVGVPKRTVITAMTRGEAVGSIFTNIDSTLVVR